jgi:hypothetical protein
MKSNNYEKGEEVYYIDKKGTAVEKGTVQYSTSSWGRERILAYNIQSGDRSYDIRTGWILGRVIDLTEY